jgi:hypothetical protein
VTALDSGAMLQASSLRWFTLLGLLAGGCNQKDIPRDFRLELASVIDSSDPARVGVRAVAADGTVAATEGEFPFTIAPVDLATVDKLGNVICRHSGDGVVALTLGPNKHTVPLKCRIVARIDASDVGRVELTAGLIKPKIRVLGKKSEDLSDVPLLLTSRNTEVLIPKGGDLLPKNVGTATILARAGQVTQTFKVDVIRSLKPEALPLENNHKIYFSLEPGKYELHVVLAESKKLTAEWRSAPYCNYAATSQDHISVCVLRAKGGVVFDSPAYLLNGSTEISTAGVAIAEVP